MNAEQRQTAADRGPSPWTLACRQLRKYIHRRHLLLLRRKLIVILPSHRR